MAYNVGDITSAVQDDLQDPSFSSTRILRYLNYGQLAIFNTHKFKFCEKAVSGALTIGQYLYAQQTDHQATIEGVVYDPASTGTRFRLTKNTFVPYREFFDRYPVPSVNTAGIPSAWTEFGDQIYFDRPVDKAYTFVQRYYRTPAELTQSSDVPTVPYSFRELLELYAEFRSEKYRGNHDIAATYEQQFEDGLESMLLRFSNVSVGPAKAGKATMRVGNSRA